MRTRRRKEGVRKVRQTYIIFCSWKSEENYFNGFRNLLRDKTNIKIETKFMNLNAESLVDKVVKMKNNNKWNLDGNDKFYVIIDRDSGNNTEQQIINAFNMGENNNIKILISNISIEVRFLMHFMVFSQSWQTVDKYVKKLTKLLGCEYIKNDTMIYEKLKDKTLTAIKNAKTAEKNIKNVDPNVKLYFYEPYTSVYKLVELLIKF